MPFTASYIAAKGDAIANLQEDLAADVATPIVQHQKKCCKMTNITHCTYKYRRCFYFILASLRYKYSI